MNLAPVFDGGTLADACGNRSFPFAVIAQEKIDGWRATLNGDTGELVGRNSRLGFYRGVVPRGTLLDGELVKDTFHAFDLIRFNGQNLTGEPIEFRLAVLRGLFGDFKIVRSSPLISEFARQIDQEGGEGIVVKRLGSTYHHGCWRRFKRLLSLDVVVVSVDRAKQSAEVSDGKKSIGRIFSVPDEINPGDVIEVHALEVTPNGKLRHGRFFKLRPDKAIV